MNILPCRNICVNDTDTPHHNIGNSSWNCAICQNIVFGWKVPLTLLVCAISTKILEKPILRRKVISIQSKVFHIKKTDKFDNRHLYTKLYTLSTAFLSGKRGFEFWKIERVFCVQIIKIAFCKILSKFLLTYIMSKISK